MRLKIRENFRTASLNPILLFLVNRAYERGGGRDNDPGAHWLKGGAIMEPVGFRGSSRGPIDMTLRNQHVEDRRAFFFFSRHLKILRKRWHFSLKTFFFFFWRSPQNSDKTAAFFPSVLEITEPETRNI